MTPQATMKVLRSINAMLCVLLGGKTLSKADRVLASTPREHAEEMETSCDLDHEHRVSKAANVITAACLIEDNEAVHSILDSSLPGKRYHILT